MWQYEYSEKSQVNNVNNVKNHTLCDFSNVKKSNTYVSNVKDSQDVNNVKKQMFSM